MFPKLSERYFINYQSYLTCNLNVQFSHVARLIHGLNDIRIKSGSLKKYEIAKLLGKL